MLLVTIVADERYDNSCIIIIIIIIVIIIIIIIIIINETYILTRHTVYFITHSLGFLCKTILPHISAIMAVNEISEMFIAQPSERWLLCCDLEK